MSTQPLCNSTSNGKQYYTSTKWMGGTSGLSSAVCSLSVFSTLFGISYNSRGFDFITILLLIIVMSSISAALTSLYNIYFSPADTEDCIQNPDIK
jgi:hypothetical protein